jgi:MerR family mercuric resistance operon transcriptional regulator
MQNTLTIGKVARDAGIGVETVRFYEREGLLEQPARRLSGYREYEPEAIARLQFIKQAQRLGFTLREIKELFALRLDPEATRAQVRQRAEAKIVDIDQRISELKRMKKALGPLIRACDGKGALEGCPILDAIENPCQHHKPNHQSARQSDKE